MSEWPGLIPLSTMLPDGTITVLLWPAGEPLPLDSFILQPTLSDPSAYNIVTDTGVAK
jgi:hypothetical protein